MPSVAVADDAQGVPAHLVGAVRALVPHAAVQTRVFDGDAAREVDDLADGELDDGARVGVGGVKHGDAHLGSRRQIDLVCADAEGSDGLEFGARAQHSLGDLGLGTQAQVVHAFERVDEVVLGQGARHAGDLDAELGENIVGDVVRVFQEQCACHVPIMADGSGKGHAVSGCGRSYHCFHAGGQGSAVDDVHVVGGAGEGDEKGHRRHHRGFPRVRRG